MTQDNAVTMADRLLAGADVDPDDLKAVIQQLKASFKFGLARKLLAKVIGVSKQEHPSHLWYQQQLALCTYKDEELPPARRFADAVGILENIGLRNPQTNDAETLSLGGAVYKRMWESNGQLEHLYEALSFYRAAYKRNPEQDRGYGGINAAYVLQILAARARAAARRSGTTAVEAEHLEREADELRRSIEGQSLVKMLPAAHLIPTCACSRAPRDRVSASLVCGLRSPIFSNMPTASAKRLAGGSSSVLVSAQGELLLYQTCDGSSFFEPPITLASTLRASPNVKEAFNCRITAFRSSGSTSAPARKRSAMIIALSCVSRSSPSHLETIKQGFQTV